MGKIIEKTGLLIIMGSFVGMILSKLEGDQYFMFFSFSLIIGCVIYFVGGKD